MNTVLPQATLAQGPLPQAPFVAKETHNKTSETRKYITFKLADYLFALPSEDILKIVATPSPSQGGMVSMGLVQLEQYSIQTLDLTKLLGLKEETSAAADLNDLTESGSAQNPPFLMVLQNTDKDLWGIAVHAPPDLMDIPNYALKPVPQEKRLTRTLRWVSDVVTYDLGHDRHTLLILDISVLLEPKRTEISPQELSFLEIEPPLETEGSNARKEEMYA